MVAGEEAGGSVKAHFWGLRIVVCVLCGERVWVDGLMD